MKLVKPNQISLKEKIYEQISLKLVSVLVRGIVSKRCEKLSIVMLFSFIFKNVLGLQLWKKKLKHFMDLNIHLSDVKNNTVVVIYIPN